MDCITFNYNIIRNNTENGIYLSGAEDAVISDNTIVDNKDNIDIYSDSARTLITVPP